MNQNTNFSMKTIGKYLRELSVIVVGVTITATVGIFMNNNSNRKDLKQYLHTIKLELENNIESIDREIDFFGQMVKYARYLESNDKKSLNSDSISSYQYVIHRLRIVTYKTNAFEMFKTSGTMRLLGNKDLLLYVWEAYSVLEHYKLLLDTIYQIKKEEALKDLQLQREGKTDVAPMNDFYSIHGDDLYEIMLNMKSISNGLRELVEMLNKTL